MLQPPYLDLSRPKPYDRPQRPSDRVVSPGPVPDHQLATQDLLPTKQIDPSTFARLFQQLVPVAVNEPLAFESRATAICASLGLDPATAADIIDSVKQQFPTIRDQEITVPQASGGPTNPQPIANSIVFKAPSTPPETSALPSATVETASLVPVKQQRPFACGSPACTIWYSTASAKDLVCPPQDVDPAVGELYIHHNRLEDVYQIWLCGLDSAWKCVTKVEKVYHPTIDDRVLSMRANGTPNWITTASYTTIRGRKGRRAQLG